MAAVEETRQDTDTALKQTREASFEISRLKEDNNQVEDWIKELMTVIDTLGGGLREIRHS